MKKLLLAFTTLSMLLLASCDKDDEEEDAPPPSLTKESLAGNYKLTAFRLKAGPLPEMDYLGNLPACIVDDIVTLNIDFTYKNTDAGVKCNPPGDDTGTWALPGNNTIDIDGDVYNVVKWDGKELVGTATGEDPDTGEPVTITVTYTRQ